MWFKSVAACIPAAIVQLAWGDEIEELFYNYWVIAVALILFGVAFIIIENKNEYYRLLKMIREEFGDQYE